MGRQPGQARSPPGPDGPPRTEETRMSRPDEAERQGTLEEIDGRWRLRFTRALAHPPEKVWRAITEPQHLQAWVPHTLSGEWGLGSPPTFRGPPGPGPGLHCPAAADPPPSPPRVPPRPPPHR